MSYRLLAATALALAVPTLGHAADPANREAALFGAREGVRQISLSPDGSRIAVLSSAPEGPGTALLIGKLGQEGGLRTILRASGSPERLSWCRWSTDARLVCGIGFHRTWKPSGSSSPRTIAPTFATPARFIVPLF